MENLFTSLEIRFSIFASLGVFIFWLFKKENSKEMKMFKIIRHFYKKENSFVELLDVSLCSVFYGIITVKLLEPTMDKQAIASGITLLHTLNFIVSKKKGE